MNQIQVRKLVRDGVITPQQGVILERQIERRRRRWPRILGGFTTALIFAAIIAGCVAFITFAVRVIVG